MQIHHTVHGRLTLKDDCERQFWNAGAVSWTQELSIDLIDVVHEQLMSTIYEQSILPVDDTMADDLIVPEQLSCRWMSDESWC